ncbi:MAG TPA: calcium-binding protein [Methylibium sp.]|nr:calcium-binding protein [Methylibium sp.]
MALLNGTAGADTLTGGAPDDQIFGLGGNDSLSGGGGNDSIDGGDANDTLVGGDGNDTLIGGAGYDTLTGGAGADVFVINGPGPSLYYQDDVVTDFQLGTDRLDVRGYGISDLATLQRLLSFDSGGSVRLEIYQGGYYQRTTFSGLWASDFPAASVTLSTVATADNIAGTSSTDYLFGGLGNDTVTGGEGYDLLFGEAGNDVIYGGSATPQGETSGGYDTLVGGAGNDDLFGGGGYDQLEGGDGTDVLDGGYHDDTLLGGAGADTFALRMENVTETDRINDFTVADGDRLDLSGTGMGDFATLQRLIAESDSGGLLTLTANGYTHTTVLNDVSLADLSAADVILSTANTASSLAGSAYADQFFGGLGNDTITGGDGYDSLFGEGGNDVIYGGSATPQGELYNGYDLLIGGAGNDTLFGGGGYDTLEGGIGNDRLDGGQANDTLTGGAGIDRFFLNRDGGAETDLVTDFSIADVDVIDLSSLGISDFATVQRLITGGTLGSSLSARLDNAAHVLTLQGISSTSLTSANFVLSALSAPQNIIGGSYIDDLFGGLGNDTITGGDGYDALFGETGNDRLYGGSATPQGELYNGYDLLVGGVGNDSLYGGGGYDTLEGGDGTDRVDGGMGDDLLSGGLGLDTFVLRHEGDYETDLVSDFSLADGDRIDVSALGISDFDTVKGLISAVGGAATLTVVTQNQTHQFTLQGVAAATLTSANFVFSTSTAADNIIGSSGYDDLFGGLGNDTLTGGDGNDRVYGETGNDVLYGGSASYLSEDYYGNDRLIGGAGNDTLYGGGGSDALRGGAGNDVLQGGRTADLLYGGADNDTASYDGETDAGIVVDLLAGTATRVGSGSVEDRLFGIENAIGTALADRLVGDAGANQLSGRTGADVLVGGAGNDTLNGGADNDSLSGGDGLDTASYAGASAAVTINLTTGVNAGADGVDTLLLIENLIGGSFADRLTGSTGANSLSGGGGADTLSGSGGNDTLAGGAAADQVAGGGGLDVFVIDSVVGSDTFSDFVSGSDTVRFNATTLTIGNGDAVIDGGVSVAGPGGFAAAAELVLVTANIAGAITTASAAAAIGSASGAYATGDDRLFVVDNGTQTALFRFTAAQANALVSDTELTLLATLSSAGSTALGDYAFG